MVSISLIGWTGYASRSMRLPRSSLWSVETLVEGGEAEAAKMFTGVEPEFTRVRALRSSFSMKSSSLAVTYEIGEFVSDPKV